MTNSVEIKNNHFKANIDLKGAQLSSLFDRRNRTEHIWQRDPAFWGDSAPNLFPIVGDLKDNSYIYRGQKYSMPKHGIVRYAPFELVHHTDDHCQVRYQSNDETLKQYPFKFTLLINFKLHTKGLSIGYTIKNEDPKIMPVGLGYHPAFAIDTTNFQHQDYELVFNQKENLDLYGLVNGRFGLREKYYLQNENTIPVTTELFKKDALIFKHIKSDQITIRRKTDNWQLIVDTGGAPHLGIWAKPGAPFVCIEPWYTYLDGPDATGNLFEKPGTVALMSGEVLKKGYGILPNPG